MSPCPNDVTRPFSSLYLDGSLFALPAVLIQEVVSSREITRVPLAAPGIEGLINLRGEIVTAINLRVLLGMQTWERNEESVNVVLRTPRGLVSLLVDGIGDVHWLDEARIEPPPANVRGEVRAAIDGVYQLGDELLLILSEERVSSLFELAGTEA